ncbi:sensor histidine kinase [Chryseotalea sanaruensis]|uniref:histidine kinase n=1 Tax=Chryseotalea sanaruensis TaxID=2482724 RepID=A0A401UFJ5_9BACT|nr:HAMP domain-containing sensor histidine kinase [Chryseotalea sanaruensis]GCC53685.1 sensor histidine kinase [Chryseotalea sanaruensis]
MKNSITIALIVFSILLLLALQILWLTNSYEKAYFDLRRDINGVFRNTVYQLRDTVFVSTIQPRIDSIQQGKQIATSRIEAIQMRKLQPDSLVARRAASTVQVYISSSDASDSLIKDLQPFTKSLQNSKGMNRSFTIRIAPDSLNIDSLRKYFKENLYSLSTNLEPIVKVLTTSDFPFNFQSHNSQSTFRWQQENTEVRPNIFLRDSLSTESVRLNPHLRYSASLTGARTLIIKEITPQILFSAILTLTIITAFVFMYRNIRSQQKLMAQKSDFISNITHELKTPVATVSVALEALQNFDVSANPEKSKEYLNIAQHELGRLSAITDNILKTTLLEEGPINIQRQIINLDNIVEKTISSLKLLIEKSNALIKFEKTNDDFQVNGNILHLNNVVSNLIENAIKYSVQHPVITIQLKKEAKVILLSIKDEGPGIAKEYHQKVFEKFFRIPTGNIHNIKGYGLGLSYVSSIVRAHKAQIELISEVNKGCEFLIKFIAASKNVKS